MQKFNYVYTKCRNHAIIVYVAIFQPHGVDVHLVTFADKEPFSSTQLLLENSHKAAGAQTHQIWNSSRLRHTHLYRALEAESSGLISSDEGIASFWWKPFVILDALQNVPSGDWVIYQDASRHIPEGLTPNSLSVFVAWLELVGSTEDIPALVSRQGLSIQWEIEQDCLWWTWSTNARPHYGASSHVNKSWPSDQVGRRHKSFCDFLVRRVLCPGGIDDITQCCESFLSAQRVSASWMVWRNTPQAHTIAQRWLQIALEPGVLKSLPFADQTILDLLWKFYDLPYFWHPSTTAFAEKTESALQDLAHLLHINYAAALVLTAQVVPVSFHSGSDWTRATTTDIEWAMSLCYQPQLMPDFKSRVAAEVMNAKVLESSNVAILEDASDLSQQLSDDSACEASAMLYYYGATSLAYLGKVGVNPACPNKLTYEVALRNSGTEAWPRDARWALFNGDNLGVDSPQVLMQRARIVTGPSGASYTSSSNLLDPGQSRTEVVHPGDIVISTLSFKMPRETGTYVSWFFMQTANSLTLLEGSGFGAVLHLEVEVSHKYVCINEV